MSYHASLPLLAAVATFALGVGVFRRKGKTAEGWVFALLSLTLVLWNLHFFVLYTVADPDLAFRLARPLRVGAAFMPTTILHLAVVMLRRRARGWLLVTTVSYAAGLALTVANFFDLLVADLRPYTWGYYSVGGPAYSFFTVFLCANFIGAIALFVRDLRTSADPRTRLQLRFWLLGAIVALPLGLTNLLPAYGLPFYPLGNLGNALWAGIVAYAIVRHRLLDIDVVITKGMAYTAVSLLLVVPAFALTLWLQQASFGEVHPDFSFVTFLLFLIIAVAFPSALAWVQSRIEQALFREKQEYRAAIRGFTRSVVRILDRDELLRQIGTRLTEALTSDRVAIALADVPARTFTVRHSSGVSPATMEFAWGDDLAEVIRVREEAVLRDELEASADARERRVGRGICRANGWEVTIPLMVSGTLIGFICLGVKRNLETFSAGDLDLLNTLAAESAIALENARLYEELEKSQDIIRRADRLSALGTLAAGIAHEIRNPLVSIQTFFQLAPKRMRDEEFMTTFFDMTAKEVRRISDLITELLSFARSPTPTLRSVDLNELAERVVALLEPEARKNKLSLRLVPAEEAPIVLADGDRIKQVLINLVLNAIQATPEGGRVELKTRSIQGAGALLAQLEVSDSGIGITPEHLENIFNPFFTTKDKGTGLGLAIAHQIISEHGGRLRVSSEVGVGTSFLVDLPLSGESPSDSAGASPQRQSRAVTA